MRSVFVDTWGWCAFTDRGERTHTAVLDTLQQRWRSGSPVITTDFVLDEAITLVFRRLPFPKAKRFLDKLDESIEGGFVDVQTISPDRFAQAKKLRLKYSDKPRISFTDFTSFVVMRELACTDVVTDDEHFEHVGFGLQMLP